MANGPDSGGAGDSPENSGPAILAEGVTKSFGAVQALRGIDLTVPRGTVLGVLGPNGAGKTTAVRIFTTLLRAGRRPRAGQRPRRRPRARRRPPFDRPGRPVRPRSTRTSPAARTSK